MNNKKVVVLAAGQGTRMKSKVPKVLHKLLDKKMIDYVIDAAKEAGADEICAVVGHKSAMVKAMIGESVSEFAVQKEQLGTGHAVMQAEKFIGTEGDVLILCGDTPLITAETIKKLFENHKNNENSATVVSVKLKDPTGYGRIIRENHSFLKIVEHKDATEKEREINEINTGVYIFKASDLSESFKELKNDNAQNEYYLTDCLEIIKEKGRRVGVMVARDENEFLGINSKLQLSRAAKVMKRRINEYHMINGVTIEDPDNTYIGKDVSIKPDTVILPGTVIEGKTEIGTDCVIGPNSRITNSIIKDGVTIQSSVLLSAEVDNYTTIGPFAYLRPNSKIGEHVKIGDFVEIKNSTIDDGTKVSHLTYVGDSDVGKNVNFGCGTVTVNYDGKNKFRTTIGDNAFIGCNTNLIAPVTIKDNAFTAAGSTITFDVPEGSLSIARAKQVNKPGWREKKED
ncbi:MAG: bifunctional UDP-N-acetylglucosamine diphosphorylase/glucosamine-1-phosphate N-acetyltransferase GlmU [Clostridiales bacterium]|jgi:bifunctional UDP-N-acetylglucosamine pyrophosphorylase/glucosamine-1-phosphate N-acetyltransferase|nr:bifunctional UDP-N-acetylglucosamine diphosphorylase/glucosamine-1-phosphate N-acetyltransferase GlmU [Clostridiales bacterium]